MTQPHDAAPSEGRGSYRNIDCPNCGRHRVLSGGICEKCSWDVDGGDYASITGRCPKTDSGAHEPRPGNNIMGPPFTECGACGIELAAPPAAATTPTGTAPQVNFMQQLPGGICFAHGPYKDTIGCPLWPKCATDPQKPEYIAMARASSPTEPAPEAPARRIVTDEGGNDMPVDSVTLADVEPAAPKAGRAREWLANEEVSLAPASAWPSPDRPILVLLRGGTKFWSLEVLLEAYATSRLAEQRREIYEECAKAVLDLVDDLLPTDRNIGFRDAAERIRALAAALEGKGGK